MQSHNNDKRGRKMKTVVCYICGKEVSKRQTVSMESIGLKEEGRVCKKHPEVQNLQQLNLTIRALQLRQLQEQKSEESNRKAYAEALEEQVAKIRAFRITHQIPWEKSLAILKQEGVSQKAIDDVVVRLKASESEISDEELKRLWQKGKGR